MDDEFEELMETERDAAIQALYSNTINFRLYQRIVKPTLDQMWEINMNVYSTRVLQYLSFLFLNSLK